MWKTLIDQLTDLNGQLFVAKLVRICIVLGLAWFGTRLVRSVTRRFEAWLHRQAEHRDGQATESTKRRDTLVGLLRRGLYLSIGLVAFLTVLSELGVNVGPLLASAGIAGLAVGFGAQNLVRDVISGFFIVLEDQVRMGDVAIVNGTGGLVEAVNFRTLVLRDLAGVVHIFPNGTVTTLSNMTKTWSAYVFDVGVAYKEDTDRVIEVMREVASQMRQDATLGPLILDDLEVFGVDKWADSAVIIKARFKTQPIKQWEVGRAYWARLKKAFDGAGIEIPFPHLSVYAGEASQPFVTRLLGADAAHFSALATPPSPAGSSPAGPPRA